MSDRKQTDEHLCQQLQWLWEDEFPCGSEVIEDSISRFEQYRNEVASVLKLLDGLTDQHGVERVAGISKDLQCLPDIGSTTVVASKCIMDQLATMRTCRDRLRELVK